MLILMLIIPVHTELHVERIETNDGFAVIQTDMIKIPTTYNYSLHIIDPTELDHILLETENIVNNLTDINIRNNLYSHIKFLKDKILTLKINSFKRTKRGLFNFIGTINKWIAGTMDDDDRQYINDHLTVTDINNHNIINTVNQQIEINNSFNRSIYTLKDNIDNDRKQYNNIMENRINETLLVLREYNYLR